MKRNIILTVLFAVFSLYFASCAKDGEIGPAGNDGTNGKDGNANVTTTIGTNLVWQDWSGASKVRAVTISVPSITQSIIDKGAVMVYSSNDKTVWIPLPMNYGDISKYYQIYLGKVILFVYYPTTAPEVLPYSVAKIVVTAGN
jgi:hypothetical protein